MANKAAKLEIQVGAETRSAVKDLDKVTAAVDDISNAAADAGSALEEIASGAADAAGAAEDSFGGIVPVFDVTAVLGAVGDLASKAGAVFADKLSAAMDFEAGTDKLQVQLNLTADQAARAGKLAGDIYAEAWGESIADVNDALGSVIRNVGIAPDSSNLKAITTQVLALVEAFEVDLSAATSAAGVLMKTGLAANAEEALDLITRGLQTSSGEADDFLEAITESSVNLKKFGFTGKQAIGLINQGMKAGAENADAITGLFEELVGNVASGGDELTEVFDSLGIDSKKVIDQLASGGPEAAEGIDTLIDAIRNIEDPLKKSAAIAALFGEEGAALQGVLESLDPSVAVDALGDVAGAAQGAADALGGNAAGKLEAFKRSVEVNLTQFIADNVIPGLTVLGDHAIRIFGEMGDAWDSFVRGFQGQEPLEATVDGGILTTSISAVEGAEGAENPTMRTIRELGIAAREFTDEWGPKLSQAIKDINTELEKMANWVKENQEFVDLLVKIGFLGIIVVGALVAIQLGIVAALIAAVGIAVGLALLPIALFIELCEKMGKKWEDVVYDMYIIATTQLAIVAGIIGTIVEVIEDLVYITLAIFNLEWSNAWNRAKETLNSIARNMIDTIGRIGDTVYALIRLIRGIPEPGFGVGTIDPDRLPRSVVPAAMLSPMAMAGTAGNVAPVFNVTIQHSGLAVDSPRLQREIVDAIRRYEKREGPLRGLMR
jgi:hypothetical protein